MRIRVLRAAEDDLRDGYHFYEQQGAGLGTYFLNSLISDIDSLILYAGIHPIHFQRYHRMLSRRFPFAVYYTLDGGDVRVHAVLDCRRNPAWTRRRLDPEA